jgi:Protein of unknown function (DUF1573)
MSFFRLGLVVLLAASASISVRAQGAQIKLIGEAKWDFGEREQGEQETRIFRLENPGDEDLDITKIGVTCGCVRVEPVRANIPPKGSIEVKAFLDTTRVAGKISKEIYIRSNASDQARITIPVRGEVLPLWWIDNRGVNFGEVDQGSGATQTVKLMVRKGRDLKLKRITSSSPHVTHVVKAFGKADDEEHGYEIELRLAPEAPAGKPLRAHIAFETDAKYKAKGFITAFAEVMGPIEIRPRRIPFGAVKRGKTVTKSVGIIRRKGQGMVIEKVFCSDPQVTWDVVEVKKGEVFRIDFTLTPKGKRTQVAGFVHVKTNVEGQRIIKLPYRAAIRP